MNLRYKQLTAAAGLAAVVLGSTSCGNVARTGRSPVMLIIDALAAQSGAQPGTFSGFLNSDVVTLVKTTVNGVEVKVPTIFNDSGKVTLRALLKDAGNPGAETAPSNLNAITVNRYHVAFRRSDGRNTQGVDVPYAFDGATTITVTSSPSEMGFELVRHLAKEEMPLVALANFGGRVEIATIADITFYGQDLAGNEVSATGSISVDFADFGDPS